MPKFIPAHTPRTAPAIVRGYLDAAEWLLDEDVDRDKICGWSRGARQQAELDCGAFERANAEDISLYCQLSGRGRYSVGHDFWLSRNGHGAGFFDRGYEPVFRRLYRGYEPVFRRLQDAARAFCECSVYCERGWLWTYPS